MKALEPKQVIGSKDKGAYAVKKIFGWTLNGPLDRKGNSCRTANFIKANDELSQQFARFCNQEFSDPAYNKDTGLCKEDLHAIGIMEQSVKLKAGHYEVALPWRHTPPNLSNN